MIPDTFTDPRRLLPAVERRRLDNGLTVCLVPNRRAPVVATALVYRAGTRHETTAEAGAAHFLEHMMFKGSPGFGVGEIDRRTRALGGSNNAFTSHDSTLYYFTFAADRWREALAIEADRMAALNLDPKEVESERRVILEEIAMYEGEPWDALDQAVSRQLFEGHPYGLPVLGTRDSLLGLNGASLGDFHRRFYRPANAILTIAGDVDAGAFDAAAEAFGALDSGSVPTPQSTPPVSRVEGLRRLERRHGEVPRMLLAWPAPKVTDPDHPLLALLLGVLTSGRSSRLHRTLVDEGQACPWVTSDLQESIDAGASTLALEVVSGAEPEAVEEEVFRSIERLANEGPEPDEVERVKRMLLADWIFAHERVHQQAFLVASAEACWDLEHPGRYFEALLAAPMDALSAAADRWLRPREGGVLGWSLPNGGAEA